MHHSKSDSEVTSLPGSSPPRSPRHHPHPHHHPHVARPAYYVQSPSRDSHDGDSKLSFQSTPLLSPLGSPLHPAGAHGRPASDAGRSSASDSGASLSSKPPRGRSAPRPPPRRVLPHPGSASSANSSPDHPSNFSHKKRPFTIFEEDELDGAKPSSGISASQIYSFLLVLVSCALFLALFILFFWLICKPSQPAVSIKSVIFHNLYMGQGADASGVPTILLSMNSTVSIDYDNPSKYFGAHLDPLAVEFAYSQLPVATKEMNGYVQGKSSRKTIAVLMGATRVPLYGANTDVSTVSGGKKQSIQLAMSASICSHYYVVGKMIKSLFCTNVACDLAVNSQTMALLTPLRSACTYYH